MWASGRGGEHWEGQGNGSSVSLAEGVGKMVSGSLFSDYISGRVVWTRTIHSASGESSMDTTAGSTEYHCVRSDRFHLSSERFGTSSKTCWLSTSASECP